MKTYDYRLCDDGGVSDAFEQEILIPIKTRFLHEYGLYEVRDYMTEDGVSTKKTEDISQVICERIKSANELKLERKL